MDKALRGALEALVNDYEKGVISISGVEVVIPNEEGELKLNIFEHIRNLLNQDFKEKVIEKFGWLLQNHWNYDEKRKVIKSLNKRAFVVSFSYENTNEFIEENWNRLDDIIYILLGYINELERREPSEDPIKEVQR